MVTQAGKKVLVLALAGYPALALQETSSLEHVMNPQPRSSFFFLFFFFLLLFVIASCCYVLFIDLDLASSRPHGLYNNASNYS